MSDNPFWKSAVCDISFVQKFFNGFNFFLNSKNIKGWIWEFALGHVTINSLNALRVKRYCKNRSPLSAISKYILKIGWKWPTQKKSISLWTRPPWVKRRKKSVCVSLWGKNRKKKVFPSTLYCIVYRLNSVKNVWLYWVFNHDSSHSICQVNSRSNRPACLGERGQWKTVETKKREKITNCCVFYLDVNYFVFVALLLRSCFLYCYLHFLQSSRPSV